MKEARNQEQTKAKAQRMSPELNEFLHLLSSLESQFSAEAAQTASRAG
jgi:predicted DNA-binding protein